MMGPYLGQRVESSGFRADVLSARIFSFFRGLVGVAALCYEALMKSTFLNIFMGSLVIGANLYSQETPDPTVWLNIPISKPDSQHYNQGNITREESRIESISSENGFVFDCYCYMHGQRHMIVRLREDDLDIRSADKACKKYEGHLYHDFGVADRSGVQSYSLTRSCSSIAIKSKSAR